MTEILTESFCERCGTRYTFESARPKTRLKSVKVLSRGLKNFVLSDDTSIDEAMAAARSETDREATAHQLDAFHKTFNFCMSCRQYTCPNCWNEPEVRCLSCAPLELPEPPVRLEDLAAFGDVGSIGEPGLIGAETARNGGPTEPDNGWVESVGALQVETEAPEAADLAAEAPVAEPELSTAAGEAAPAEAAPQVAADPARKAAAQTTGLLRRFRPGQNLDAELEAFERERSESARAAAPAETLEAATPAATAESLSAETPVEAPAAEAAPAGETLAETAPVAETTPPAGEPALQPQAAEPEPQPIAASSASDVVEQPTWTITAPDASGTAPLPPTSEPGGSIPIQASAAQPGEPGGEPQWPARPQWPGATPTAGLPFLGRPAAGQGGIEALWAASNQELVTAAPPPGRAAPSTGIQPCVSCGLSLSATARFCRRCGTLQVR